DGSGLDEARALMHGRTVRAVMGVGVGNDRGRRGAEIVRSNLAPIGIDVDIEEIPGLGYEPPPAEADVDLYGLGIGPFLYADPADFLYVMMFLRVTRGWAPGGGTEEVKGLGELTGTERRAAAVALADRLATDEVPVAVTIYGVT